MAETVKYTMMEGCEDLVPQRQHETDAAFDLRSREDIQVEPGKFQLVGTGFRMELPFGYEAQVRPRSGLAAKFGISIVNTPGTVDAGYRGEVKVILINHGEAPFPIKRGDRIAQMVIQKLPEINLVKVDELSDSDRGAAGFGSTGKQ